MIFEPFVDESEKINVIHEFNSNEYVLIRISNTMIEKNIIDANALFRDMMKRYNVLDYNDLEDGGKNGKRIPAIFLNDYQAEQTSINMYTANKRRDPRFSIRQIKKFVQKGKFTESDLLYFTVTKINNEKRIIIINLSKNTPNPELLQETFGINPVIESFNRLLPMLKSITKAGYHPNSKGKGKVSDKDVGDTLESLLGIKTNNSTGADFENKIEIKSKTGNTLSTLFTLRPRFENTKTALVEPVDRSRVSAFTRLYGYKSDKRPLDKSLYITIGNKMSPQNSQGFYLEVNEKERQVELWLARQDIEEEMTAFWEFDSLEKALKEKHPATLWVKAKKRQNGEVVEFNYYEAELTLQPQFTTFLSLIKSGAITYDWRGYTSQEGKYVGKNHGNAWRIKSQYQSLLFDSVVQIDL